MILGLRGSAILSCLQFPSFISVKTAQTLRGRVTQAKPLYIQLRDYKITVIATVQYNTYLNKIQCVH